MPVMVFVFLYSSVKFSLIALIAPDRKIED